MMRLNVVNPEGRWTETKIEYDDGETPTAYVQYLEDHSQSILSRNTSPDLHFEFSVNPYRGCMHGCAYCYARPSHEYLGLGSGSDFERKIVVKPKAAALLKAAFDKKSWKGDLVMFSGVTDCYQPIERKLGLTRACLEVCAAYKNPISIITKAPLVERDIDLIQRISKVAMACVTLSIPFVNAENARALEPTVASPERRFETVRQLSAAGIRTGISVSPVIPGLNEEEIPEILERAKEAGAAYAFHSLLRLPGTVKEVFEARIAEQLPMKHERIMKRIRAVRDGGLDNTNFFERHKGEGIFASTIHQLFNKTARRLKLDDHARMSALPSRGSFERPTDQLSLFARSR